LGVLKRVRRHARSVEHLARDEDRKRVPKRQCDPVGGTCVRSALAHLHEHAGDESLAADLVDLYAHDLPSQLANDRLDQVVGERPRVVLFRQTELDGDASVQPTMMGNALLLVESMRTTAAPPPRIGSTPPTSVSIGSA